MKMVLTFVNDPPAKSVIIITHNYIIILLEVNNFGFGLC